MKGYVFISNSTKPSEEKRNSREKIIPTNFSRPCLNAALEHGYKVICGVNRSRPEELSSDLPIMLYDQHSYRSVTALRDNLVALKNLDVVLKTNDIEVIHCNTPVGGVVGRLCGKRHHIKYIIYTAHGFHFYKGAPLINRTLFQLAERLMALWTDAIITINEEDYQTAKTFKLKKGGRLYKVHGVGINTAEYENTYYDPRKRAEIGVSKSDFLCISAGDLIVRKNYATAIKAITYTGNPSIHYAICGKGPELDRLKGLAAELGVESQVHFLGFRSDIKELMKTADLFLFTTFQEGLPRSLMEAMASGLPVCASRIRGNTDLIDDGIGGFLHEPDDALGFAESIQVIAGDQVIRTKMSEANMRKIKEYDISVVQKEINQIYDELLPFYNS